MELGPLGRGDGVTIGEIDGHPRSVKMVFF